MVRICVRFRGPSCRLSVHLQYRGHRTACGLVTGRVWRRAGTDLGDGGYCCEQRMVAKPPWASSQRAMQCQCGTLISALWWVDWGKGLEVCGARAPRIRGIEQPSQMAFTYCHLVIKMFSFLFPRVRDSGLPLHRQRQSPHPLHKEQQSR